MAAGTVAGGRRGGADAGAGLGGLEACFCEGRRERGGGVRGLGVGVGAEAVVPWRSGACGVARRARRACVRENRWRLGTGLTGGSRVTEREGGERPGAGLLLRCWAGPMGVREREREGEEVGWPERAFLFFFVLFFLLLFLSYISVINI